MKTMQQLEAENEDLRARVCAVEVERNRKEVARWEVDDELTRTKSRLNAVIEASSIAEAGRLRYEEALKQIADRDDQECIGAVIAYEALNPLSISGSVQRGGMTTIPGSSASPSSLVADLPKVQHPTITGSGRP